MAYNDASVPTVDITIDITVGKKYLQINDYNILQ